MAAITRKLDQFLNNSHEVIGQLGSSRLTEVMQGIEQMSEGDSNYTSINARWSHEKNMEVSNQLNRLKKSSQKINALLAENEHLIAECPVQRLNTDFDGESIKRCENAEWELIWRNTFLPGCSSDATSQAISDTCEKVKAAESQALVLYNYLNPDNPREISSCCRECIIL